jgi:hypothetical protein
MPGRHATDEEKEKALEIYVTDGPSQAARVTGFSKASICNWARQAGVSTKGAELTQAATQMSLARRNLNMAQWREAATEYLRDISIKALEVEGALLSQTGNKTPQLDKVITARSKAISDLLLLSGEATQRIGLTNDTQDQRDRIAALRDELEARKQIEN